MEMEELLNRQRKLIDQAEHERQERERRARLEYEKAQTLGAEYEQRYDAVVQEFRGLFEAVTPDWEDPEKITQTVAIVLGRSGRGQISAVVKTLPSKEDYYFNTWDTKISREVPPSYRNAENFEVTFTISGDNKSEKATERFDAKRIRQDDLPYNPLRMGEKYYPEGVEDFVSYVDYILLSAKSTLEILINAARDPKLNMDLSKQVLAYYGDKKSTEPMLAAE